MKPPHVYVHPNRAKNSLIMGPAVHAEWENTQKKRLSSLLREEAADSGERHALKLRFSMLGEEFLSTDLGSGEPWKVSELRMTLCTLIA